MWLKTVKGRLFPNLYITIVTPPGVGKSLAMALAREALTSIGEADNKIHIAPTSMSAASLADTLSDAVRKIRSPNPLEPDTVFNSLLLHVTELANFLTEYNPEIIARLTDLYDCGTYEERKRGRDLKIQIPNTQLNFIAATTPSHLNAFIPPGAWDQGFMSRMLMVYSGESTLQLLFSPGESAGLTPQLTSDLEQVFGLFGEFAVEEGFISAIHKWQSGGQEPVPTHPRLLHYNTRRASHILKLSMIAAIDRSSEMVVRLEDFVRALDWLLEAEAYMPEIFKASGTSGDSAIMDECFHFVFNEYVRDKKPISEHRILDFLRKKIATPQVLMILDIMIRSNMLEKVNMPIGQRPFYKPVPVQQHQ